MLKCCKEKVFFLLVYMIAPLSIFGADIMLSGYGSIAGVYQENKNILYRTSTNTGKGSQGNISFATDSILGLQLDIKATEKLSFIFQGILSENNGNNKLFSLESANVKYQFNDSFDIHIGKMQMPAYMFSDVVNIAYTYNSIRLPDMYYTIPFRSYIGTEVNYAFNYEKFSIEGKLFYGEDSRKFQIEVKNKGFMPSKVKNNGFMTSNMDADNIFGLTLGVSSKNLKLRFAYTHFDFTIENELLSTSMYYFRSLGISAITEAASKYALEKTPLNYLALGFEYDFEDAYILGEYIELDSDSFKADTTSWYLSAGYRFDDLIAFATFSKTTSSSNYKEIDISSQMPTQLVDAISTANNVFSKLSNAAAPTQDTISVGARYELMENISLKVQYDHIKKFKPASKVDLHFNNQKQPTLHVFSAAINFIF